MMKIPPKSIDGACVVQWTAIDKRHRATGNCDHSVFGEPASVATGLAICRYQGEDAYYLFRCDAGWTTITDTLHETLEQAIDQAEFEYAGTSRTWDLT